MATLDSAIQTLVARLETVVARLESVERAIASGGPSHHAGAGAAAAPAAGSGETAPYVAAFDGLIAHIDKFLEAANKIGGDVATQAQLVKNAVQEQRKFLEIASRSKKPSTDVLAQLVKPTGDILAQIGSIRDKNRAHKDFNLLSTVSEGIGGLGWVTVSPTPGPFVDEAKASAEFYSNRVLREFKGKDQDRVDFVQGYISFFVDLRKYVKDFHTTEVAWNPRGGDAAAAASSSPAPAAPSGGPKPPPAPLAPLAPAAPPAGAARASASPAALFAEIAGGGVDKVKSKMTHITKDMKTANRADKSSVVSDVPKPASSRVGGEKRAAVAKPPVFTLEGNKWRVEHQVGGQITIEGDMRQAVYIYQCSANTVVNIKGKVNTITIDGCRRTGVCFESAIALAEVVNSHDVQIQCTGTVPAFAIDKTSGVHLFLSKDCLAAEIITSKSDEMNVNIPDPADPANIIEISIPEQFKTTIRDGKLITGINSHV